MYARVLHERPGERQFTITMERGEGIVASLQRFARHHGLDAVEVRAHGAVEDVILGFWDPLSGQVLETRYDEQLELASLTGRVARPPDDDLEVLLHVVLARRDHTTRAGRLVEARVGPAVEVMLTELATSPPPPARAGADEALVAP